MSAPVNRQIVLAARPQGMVKAGDFRLETTPVPEPGPGQILVRNIWMSVDPYLRGRMNDRKSYAPPFEVDKPLDGRAVGRVLKSNHPTLKEGAVVSNMQGWRDVGLPGRLQIVGEGGSHEPVSGVECKFDPAQSGESQMAQAFADRIADEQGANQHRAADESAEQGAEMGSKVKPKAAGNERPECHGANPARL